jgi:hypothetical protein
MSVAPEGVVGPSDDEPPPHDVRAVTATSVAASRVDAVESRRVVTASPSNSAARRVVVTFRR